MKTDETPAERLFELTQQGRLKWLFHYEATGAPEDYTDDQGLADYTRPSSYVLEDNQYGFGVVLVRLKGVEQPVLYIQGVEIDDPQGAKLLADAIQIFFRELQTGTVPPAPSFHEQVHAAVMGATEPLRVELSETKDVQQQLLDIAALNAEAVRNMSLPVKSLPADIDLELFKRLFYAYFSQDSELLQELWDDETASRIFYDVTK